jgi:hypothetical protein
MEKGLRKTFPRFMPFNPLKSLDSDERIQGNPRQSNTHLREPSRRKGQGQENPNGPMSRPADEKEPNRLHPTAKRPAPRLSPPLKTGEGYRLRFDATRRRHSIWSFPSGRPVILTGGGCCETTGGGGSCGGAG